MDHVTHVINNKPWNGTAERHGTIYDPATGKALATVDFATAKVVDLAVQAAAAAFASWGTTSISKRTEVLFSFRELLSARRVEIAKRVSAEHGKVLTTRLAR